MPGVLDVMISAKLENLDVGTRYDPVRFACAQLQRYHEMEKYTPKIQRDKYGLNGNRSSKYV